ncbi:MAG TPA: ketoacyl-ACP synthase III [Bryobacteraceae bacterium]|nr:ketoacyl-ACP synthase III [Bryobacteraceae bacterium]
MKSSLQAAIRAIEFHLPERVETALELAAEFPEWQVEKIEKRTGIRRRHIAAASECASDLAIAAARKLFDSGVCTPAEIDFILLCTQTPDYFLPTTACVIQDRLGIPTSAGALDFNLGSSGFVYGLSLAQGLIEQGSARKILLLTADTYSKLIHPADKSVRVLFGDGAAAALVAGVEGLAEPALGPYVFGSDGRGAQNLIVPAGAMREPHSAETAEVRQDEDGNRRSRENLFMDGGEIFAFTLNSVPKLIRQLLERTGKAQEEIDLFVFHQPNRAMLETMRKQLKIPGERFYIYLEDCGNTVSATIPIALKAAQTDGTLKPGMLVMLVGFGVGYSWAATLVRWQG